MGHFEGRICNVPGSDKGAKIALAVWSEDSDKWLLETQRDTEGFDDHSMAEHRLKTVVKEDGVVKHRIILSRNAVLTLFAALANDPDVVREANDLFNSSCAS